MNGYDSLKRHHKAEIEALKTAHSSLIMQRDQRISALENGEAEQRQRATAWENRFTKEAGAHNATRDAAHAAELEVARLSGVLSQMQKTHPPVMVAAPLEFVDQARIVANGGVLYGGGQGYDANRPTPWWHRPL